MNSLSANPGERASSSSGSSSAKNSTTRAYSLPAILSGSVKDFAKTVSVPTCKDHPGGFTLYKIVIQVVPRNSLEENPVKFIAWRRYKDLFKLWQKLHLSHQQLHLHGNFPDFPKPKLFGKHDPGTVSERKGSTEAFLDCAVKNPVLGRLAPLQEFFSEGITVEDDLTSTALDPALKPTSAAFPLCDLSPQLEGTHSPPPSVQPLEIPAAKNMEAAKGETLEPTPFLDTESLQSDEQLSQCSTDHLERSRKLSSGSSTQPDADISFFDPFKGSAQIDPAENLEVSAPSSPPDTAQSDKWLMESMNELKETGSELQNQFCADNPPQEHDRKSAEAQKSAATAPARISQEISEQTESASDLFAIEDCSLPTPPPVRKEEETRRRSGAPSIGETPEFRSPAESSGASESARSRDPAELEFERRASERESLTSRIAKFFPKMSAVGLGGGGSGGGGRGDARGHRRPLEAEAVTSTGDLIPPGAGLKQVRSEGNFLAMVAGLDSEPPEREAQHESISDKIAKHAFGARNLHSNSVGRKGNLSPNRRLAGARSRGNSGAKTSEDDYLIQAAHFISSAQKSEAEGAHDLAFSCYKSAVNLLLQGVQAEKDLARRNAVRKKTAKYLVKAERIYRNHLAFDSCTFDVDKWTADFSVRSPSVQDPTLIPFQGSYSELKQYKFVKRLARGVQVVRSKEEFAHGGDQDFVLKFLDKTWNNASLNLIAVAENFVPINVPYMVHLVKFYETEKSVILLLEYARKGRLWKFLAKYLAAKRRKTDPAKSEEIKSRDLTPPGKIGERAKNRYVGRSVTFSVGEGSLGLSEELEEVLASLDSEDCSAFGEVLQKRGSKTSAQLKALRNSRDKKMRDSLGSMDSLSIDTAHTHPSTSTGVSPNPELKFQNVFTKISAEIGDFSIEEEVGEEKPRNSNKGSLLNYVRF